MPLELSDRERDLIIHETFVDPELTDRLRLVRVQGKKPVFRFTLDELDEFAGYVAAEASHAKSKKLQKELDRISERLSEILQTYTDEED